MAQFTKYKRIAPEDVPTPQTGFVFVFVDPNDNKLYSKDWNNSVTPMEGPQGIQGEQGPQGDPGPAGADGAQGPQGEQGPQGDPGGPQGPQGPEGPQGPAGNDGAIQYQFPYSVTDQGSQNIQLQGDAASPGADYYYGTDYTGSKGWFALPAGPQGPQGPAGNDGAPGANGSDGAQGPAGADGATGPAGFSIFGSPASNDAGSEGETRWDTSYLYICISANSWKRVALESY